MDFDQIKLLMHTLEESKLQKLVFKKGDFELHLEKGTPAPQRVVVAQEQTAEPAHSPAVAQTAHHSKVADKPGSFVTSPMVGTFYASPSPDQPHFVKVGDRVTEETIVCIVEAMKVMNEVKAGVSGTVAETISVNGQPVEFGSRLFRIT